MKKTILYLALLAFCAFVTGCAAPGSAMCRVHVRGRLRDASGHPMRNQQVDVLLPSQYGLSGLDAGWGEPEDYGHQDQMATLATDDTGRFDHAFMPTTYSIVFWLIPPLGPVPKRPPEPCFCLKLPSQTNEYWVLWMTKEGLETKLIERGKSTPQEQSQVLPAEFTGNLIWEDEADPPGYLVDFEMNLLSETETNGAKGEPEATR